ncbi:TniQ family protein [Thioclava sp. IC9]|uniref:TniQ family protein n=1 Tax=Thioclava sp. IC9 TaxID=1973007 RepID=UPI000B5407D1|nr:TniQ family protein [Thioclava sp. IC9]OWY02924.1 hypothetical protein B6V76_08560 [Thioclava sp. IC9]
MPHWLPERLRPAHRETLPSFFSRLAASKGVSAKNLALDMGVSLKRLVTQDPEALEQLRIWSRLTDTEFADLLSWTGVGAGDIQQEFRGELVGSRSLRNPAVRGCPLCLAEDAAAGDRSPFEAMVMRGDWQFKETVRCVRHGADLVPLWRANSPSVRYDIGLRLQEILPALLAGDFFQPRSKATEYDHWLDARLENGTDATWLARHSLYAATTMCRLLGACLQRLPGQAEQDPHQLGFDALRNGERSFQDTLNQLADHCDSTQFGPSKTFGSLHEKLSRNYAKDPQFAEFRQCLRDCILENWPVGSGELVLGEALAERRLHSVTSVSVQTGVGPAVVEALLIEAGAVMADDPRPRARKTFDAKGHAGLVAIIPQLVGPMKMRKAMGATRSEFRALVELRELSPVTRIAGFKTPWLASEGIRFVEGLRQKGGPIPNGERGWSTIQLASTHTGIPVSQILAGIRSEALGVGLRDGELGYHGICVSRNEIKAMKDQVQGTTRMWQDGSISIAAFGRSIGIRDHGTFTRFAEAGHCPAHLVRNPHTGQNQLRMTEAEIALFHERFVTPNTIATETGLHRNTIWALLKDHDIAPFSAGGHEFGRIYLRKEMVAILPDGAVTYPRR